MKKAIYQLSVTLLVLLLVLAPITLVAWQFQMPWAEALMRTNALGPDGERLHHLSGVTLMAWCLSVAVCFFLATATEEKSK